MIHELFVLASVLMTWCLYRFDRNTIPDKFSCVKDVWIDPLPQDTQEIVFLRQMLAKTNLESRPLALAYDANR